MQKHKCDVLIIGAGGAALRAGLAITEKDPACKVILATKGKLGSHGVTANACSDRMAFHATLPYTEPSGKDNWKEHADDIYRIGGYVSDEDLARILAKNSQEAFEYLDNLGVPWTKKDGRADQFVTDGSQYARACYTGPYTANHIEEALVGKFIATPVNVLEDIMIIDLLLSSSKDRVVGAVGLNSKEEMFLILAKAVILATGGAGEIFKVNVYPPGMSGDGYAASYRAGAELVNMEFIQIGLSSVKTKLACSGSMMRAIPRFINDEGEEFLSEYFPEGTPLSEIYLTVFQKGASWPVSFEHKTHIIDIAVYKELRKGRKVYLDYSRNPQGLKWEDLEQMTRRYKEGEKPQKSEMSKSPLFRLKAINPKSIDWLKARGIDINKGDKLEIAPAAQHFQGGIKIRENAGTSVKGLYAAGECAGGQHGANRPGGNALLDSQVFGKIAALSALEESKRINVLEDVNAAGLIQTREKLQKGEKASLVRTRIQDILFSCASIIRTEEGLSKGLKELEEIEKIGVRTDDKGLIFALETLNILNVAQMVMGAARMRKESRGPHLYFRKDDNNPLPRDDKKWKEYIVIKKYDINPHTKDFGAGGNMKFEPRKPVSLSKN